MYRPHRKYEFELYVILGAAVGMSFVGWILFRLI